MIVGTAGHIDHGKTSLVKALTGVDADRLKEEKARGITIDLGYAYQPLPGGEVLGFIDVPGHEKFIHNMLAGATGIDHVLLVVAADDGPMPQTVEHLAILGQLGLARGVVALTKIDRVDAVRRAAAIDEVRRLLAGSAQAGFAILPVSSVSGEGLAELRAALQAAAEASASAERVRDASPFRLAIDRSFTLDGIGTVVTGTVFDGTVTVGDRLMLSPLGLEVRVRSLHAQNRAAASGSRGQRCALNIVAPQLDRRSIERGQWLLAPALHAPTQHLDARLDLLPSEARALRQWTPVHVHLGAAHVNGRVALLQDAALQPGASALVQLVLDQPVGALHGDRFIVRDTSAQRTLGGGRVLDASPSERGRRKPQRAAWLAALEADTPQAVLLRLLEASPVGIELAWFARMFKLDAAALAPWLSEAGAQVLALAGKSASGPRAFSAAHWQQLAEQALIALARYHARQPDSAGANPQELRGLMPQRPDVAVVASLLGTAVAQQRVLRVGARFQLADHRVTLSAAEQQLWQRARPRLDVAGLAPPQVPELARDLGVTDESLRTLFCRLARLGQLHRVRREVFFLPQTVALLAAQTAALAQATPRGVVTVGPFRETTGLHRNLGIPMLEFFDRAGFTMRLKDGRRVRQDSAVVFGDAALAHD